MSNSHPTYIQVFASLLSGKIHTWFPQVNSDFAGDVSAGHPGKGGVVGPRLMRGG